MYILKYERKYLIYTILILLHRILNVYKDYTLWFKAHLRFGAALDFVSILLVLEPS